MCHKKRDYTSFPRINFGSGFLRQPSVHKGQGHYASMCAHMICKDVLVANLNVTAHFSLCVPDYVLHYIKNFWLKLITRTISGGLIIRNPQVQETNRHTFDAIYRSVSDTVDVRCIPSQKDFGFNSAQDPADTFMGPSRLN